MAQVLFAADTTPSLTDLDANFTELFQLRDLFTVSGANVGIGGTPAVKLDVVGVVRVQTTNSGTSIGTSEDAVRIRNSATTGWYGVSFVNDVTTNAEILCAGSGTSGAIVLATSNAGTLAERLRIEAAGHGAAGADNAQTWGTAAKRWSVLYAGTGTINTSDAREKTAVLPMSESEIQAAKQLSAELGTFQFLNAVEVKGQAARIHVGMTVQRAMEIMRSNGLDPLRYGFICHDAWPEQVIEHPEQTEAHKSLYGADGLPLRIVVRPAWTETVPAGDRYAFRTDELLLFIARGFEARIASLEAA